MRNIEIIQGSAQNVVSSTEFRIDGKAITFWHFHSIGLANLNVSEGDRLTVAGTDTETGFRVIAVHNHTTDVTYGRPSKWFTVLLGLILCATLILAILIIGIPFLLAAIWLLYLDRRSRKAVKLIEHKIAST